MKYRRFLLSLVVSLLAVSLGGCAGSKGKDDDEQTQQSRLPAYFEEIPADTFFFAGGTEPIPAELVASTLSSFDTLLEWEEEINSLDSSLETTADDAVEAAKDEPEALIDLLVEEMGGELNADGLEKIGLSASPRVAAYSVGTVPVVRFELSDEEKFLAFVDRLEKTLGQQSTNLSHQKTSYRRYSEAGRSSHLLLRTTANEAVIAVAEEGVFELFLPYFTGAKKPKVSLADDNEFLRTVETNGFERFGAGYVDLEQIVAYATGTETPEGITKAILDRSDFEMKQSEACKAETLRLVRMMPKLVGGFRHYDKNTIDVAFGAELEESIARELSKTVVGAPGHDTAFAQKSLIEIGLGIDVGQLIEFAAGQARKVRAKQFQCEEFADINQGAGMLMGVTGSVPQAVRKLAGFNLLIRNVLLEWRADDSKNGTLVFIPRILGALRTEQPEALMYLVRSQVPETKGLQPKPDGKPVAIPTPSDAYEGIIEPILLMTERGLAVSVGPKMAEEARGVLGAKEAATTPALIARLNLGDPARELVGNMETLVDKAEADKDARGLTDEDIAGARRAIAVVKGFLPEGPWAATFTTEFSEFGVLLAYRDQGALDFELEDKLGETTEADFKALEKVLGAPNPIAEADEKEARLQLGNLEQMLEMYYTLSSPHAYPERLQQLVDNKITFEIPLDPWDQPYVYRRTSTKEYSLSSKGPDQQEGTEDDIELESAAFKEKK